MKSMALYSERKAFYDTKTTCFEQRAMIVTINSSNCKY